MGLINTTFLKWWIQFFVLIFAAYMMHELDLFRQLWEVDQTFISFGLIGLFIICTCTIGYLSFRNDYSVHEKYSNYIWFSADTMITLGLVGTVIGFMFILGSFAELDVSNHVSVLETMSHFSIGMATALTTTLTGLVCSTLTKMQMIILENQYEEAN